MKGVKELVDDFYSTKYYDYNHPTELCNLMDKYGSDKGPNFKGAGNYTKMYDILFREIKDDIKYFFEVGLGTNNTDVPSNMGSDGVPGSSLRGFRDYFQNAQIFGADVDKRILFEEDRIKTFYVDQKNPDTIRELWSNFEGVKFDIIIDDGIHDTIQNPSGNRIFFDHSIHMLKSGGYYIIEDVAFDYDGDRVHEMVYRIVNDIREGKYGPVSYVEVLKTPAPKGNGEYRNTQIILIQK